MNQVNGTAKGFKLRTRQPRVTAGSAVQTDDNRSRLKGVADGVKVNVLVAVGVAVAVLVAVDVAVCVGVLVAVLLGVSVRVAVWVALGGTPVGGGGGGGELVLVGVYAGI